MKLIEIDCFEVVESYDRESKHIAYTSTKELAQELVSKSKNYRSMIAIKKIFVIFETSEDVTTYSKENLRKSGLAKLSVEERLALGL